MKIRYKKVDQHFLFHFQNKLHQIHFSCCRGKPNNQATRMIWQWWDYFKYWVEWTSKWHFKFDQKYHHGKSIECFLQLIVYLPKTFIALSEWGYLKWTNLLRSISFGTMNFSLYRISCSVHILNAFFGTIWHSISIAFTV